MTPVEQQLRTFITENFFVEDADLRGEISLTRSGIIDSTGVMEILLFLETQFGIKVPDDEITPENLDTLDALVSYVSRMEGKVPA
jgi:acyl carrier protein